MIDDVNLGLAHADRLQQNQLAARGVHQQRRLERGLAQPSERAAVGHRADEHARIQKVIRKADPVAEQGALGERRGGVDRQHPNGAFAFALELGQGTHQGGLADPWRSGEPHDGRLAGVGVNLAHQRPAIGVVILDQRDRARQRALVPGHQALGE